MKRKRLVPYILILGVSLLGDAYFPNEDGTYFSLFIMFAALLSTWIISCMKKMMNPSVKKWLTTLLLICFVTEVLFQGMFFFVDTESSLMNTRSDLYSRAMYLIAFWL